MQSGSRTDAGFRINEGPLEQGHALKDNSRVAVIGGGPGEVQSINSMNPPGVLEETALPGFIWTCASITGLTRLANHGTN